MLSRRICSKILPFMQCPCGRSLYSKTGRWKKQYTLALREELETFWKDKLKRHRPKQTSHEKQKYYVLSMFPYPSGQLHMGHVRVYTISDAMARYHRLAGKHVIHPMGWDAFGLPAENAAIERGERPDKWTYSNIESMKKQLEDLCCSFDWEREYATCDPEYYRWTQYIFLKMYEAGLVYQKQGAVNWDPVDQTVLADEQIDENGRSWRSGALAEKRFLKQWYIKTTMFYKSLLEGLDEVDPDMWKDVILLQKEWIGDCNGVTLEFKWKFKDEVMDYPLSIFTTCPQAVYGASHIALSPEHALNQTRYYKDGNVYEDAEAIELDIEVVNPFTREVLPVYIVPSKDFGEYLDSHLGIPSALEEDRIFATEHGLKFRAVIDTEQDFIVNSDKFSGLSYTNGFGPVVEYAKELKCGGHLTSERGRDWLISRQRFWGTPIPVLHCPKYGTMPVPYEDLPVTLPKVTSLTGKGESPLAQETDWLNVKCPKCDCDSYARRETDTMDTFVDSSWYFLRYLDPQNTSEPFSKEAANKYMPVDLYIGGKEHAIMHLYYARFFNHFLYGEGLLPQREPFVNLLTQGMVMGKSYKLKDTGRYLRPDEIDFSGKEPVHTGTGAPLDIQWEKMSKSKYNGVDPQAVLDEHGVDASRLCILSNVAPKSDRNWSPDAFVGIVRWQSRIWSIVHDFIEARNNPTQTSTLSEQDQAAFEEYIFDSRNYFLKEVTYHMEKTFLISVAVSRLQGLTNALRKVPEDGLRNSVQFERGLCDLVIMLSPFAPLFTSELWAGISNVPNKLTNFSWDESVLDQTWPELDPDYRMALKVKVNGKEVYEVRLPMPIDEAHTITEEEALHLASSHKDYDELIKSKNITGWYLYAEPGHRIELVYKTKKKKKSQKQQAA